MAQPVNIPDLDQLKQALVIAEKIERLQFDLATVISSAGVKSNRRGRPAKGTLDLAGFLEAASRIVAGAPAKGKRGPKPKDVAAKPAKGRGRGRGPATPNAKAADKPVRKKRVMSEEGRKRIIEAQKKRWAAVAAANKAAAKKGA